MGSGGSIGTQTPMKAASKSANTGMTRALRPQSRVVSPNNRANIKNPNNPAFRAAASNRSNQMNPNNPAHRSSRGGGRRK